MWWYPIFKSSDVAYLKPSSFYNIPLILGIGYGLRFLWLFKFLNPLIKRTGFVLDLGCTKDGSTLSESFEFLITPSGTKRSTSFLKNSLCNFGTIYGLENMFLEFYFNSNSTGSVFQLPSVP